MIKKQGLISLSPVRTTRFQTDSEIILVVIQKQVDRGEINSWEDCPSNWLKVLESHFGEKAKDVDMKLAYLKALRYYKEKRDTDYSTGETYVSICKNGIDSMFVVRTADRMKAFQMIKRFFSPTKTEDNELIENK